MVREKPWLLVCHGFLFPDALCVFALRYSEGMNANRGQLSRYRFSEYGAKAFFYGNLVN